MDNISSLIAAAALAIKNAHAPYSNYRVGAALLDVDGKVYTGCNVENASYGLTMCAERIACFNAIASGSHEYQAIAVVCDSETLPLPCGACRQVLAEFCDPEFLIYVASTRSPAKYEQYLLGKLLPHTFKL